MNLTKHWAAQLDDYVIDLAWSPDGRQLAAASASGPLAVFAAHDGQRRDLPGHEDGSNCLAWQPGSSSVFASGGQDGTVKFWDAAAGQHLRTSALGQAWVEQLAWRPAPAADAPVGDSNPRMLLAAAAGRSVHFLAADGTVVHTTKTAPKTLSALAWQPAGGCLAAAYFGGVCLWDADDFVPQKEMAYGNGIHALIWSPDNRWLVSGNQDPSVHLWLPEQDQEFHMSGYEGKVKELSFDPSGRWLATGGGRDCCVWDCTGTGPEGREPVMLPHEATVCAVAFQRAHRLLATASEDGVLQLWSVDRQQPLRATVRMPATATRLAWSPDDSQLAVGSEKGIIYVLRCQT
jgi:WD40 repeat protein